METQKTTARSILLPLALGTFSFCLTTGIANKIFKNIPQRALMYGGSIAFPVTLITWGLVRNKKIDPVKLLRMQEQQKTEKILDSLKNANVDSSSLRSLVEQRNWSELSQAIWSQCNHTQGEEPSKVQTVVFKNEKKLTYHESLPIDKIIFTETELLDFNAKQLERLKELYTQVEVDGKPVWIAKSDYPIHEQYKTQTADKKIDENTEIETHKKLDIKKYQLTFASQTLSLSEQNPSDKIDQYVSVQFSSGSTIKEYWASRMDALTFARNIITSSAKKKFSSVKSISINQEGELKIVIQYLSGYNSTFNVTRNDFIFKEII